MALAEVGEGFAVGIEAQDEPVQESGSRLFTAHAPNGTALIPYEGTHALGGVPDPNIIGVIKINCGMLRDEVNYFKKACRLVKAAGLEGKVAIFALGPRTDADIFAQHPIKGLPDDLELRRKEFAYWTTREPEEGPKVIRNWKNGDNAVSPVPISWYGVHDQVEDTICTSHQFPRLEWVKDIGNSAQGQGVQRRTAVGAGPNPAIVKERGIVFSRYDMNGATNLFFNDWRPRPVRPEHKELINSWRCGFRNAPDYVRRQKQTPLDYLGRFASRNFVILRGTEDNKPTIGAEVHPAALAQDPEGCPPNRFQRGSVWSSYMLDLFMKCDFIETSRFKADSSTSLGGSFNFVPVPRKGHDAADMFSSPEALTAIFGTPAEVAKLNALR